MDIAPYTLNFNSIGVQVNKDIAKTPVLSLYHVHKAGSTHGTGLFAARDIYQNEEVIKVIGPTVTEQVADVLYSSYGIDVLIQVGIKNGFYRQMKPDLLIIPVSPTWGSK